MAILATGCGGQIQGKPPFTAEDVRADARTIVETPRTQGEVRALLGTPWVESDKWHFDLFRMTGKQRNWVLLLPLPVPLPDFSNKLYAYTLVAYSDTGMVLGVDAGFSQDYWGLVVKAGDFEFEHNLVHDTLSVSSARFKQVHKADAGSTCTVLVGCESGACWTRVQVDRGAMLELPLFRFTLPMPSAPDQAPAQAPPLGNEAIVESGPRMLAAPIIVGQGVHHLRFSSRVITHSLETQMNCSEPGLVYAIQHGETTRQVPLTKQLFNGLKEVDATGSVVIASEPPKDIARQNVILFFDGTWLVDK